ncbi:hypothetical protein RGUI_3228 [Rhodovulum sp. P5]|uniref:hypothetical protein n=1 Tax=Rhodovulum sp. P5 TaxID=1564506 RepID=UPI0009C1D581|nr:hypothetical protein [Rhodovulum sp. P5]ARE41369.1 hypothetical protein RGUI_3228 [Rhodovulum sp. P5]
MFIWAKPRTAGLMEGFALSMMVDSGIHAPSRLMPGLSGHPRGVFGGVDIESAVQKVRNAGLARNGWTWAIASAGLAVVLAALILHPAVHVPEIVPGTDKYVHVAAFASLILPGSLFHPRALWWLAPVMLAFASATEYLQAFVGRNACWSDAAANALGLAVGIALGLSLSHVARRVRAARDAGPALSVA